MQLLIRKIQPKIAKFKYFIVNIEIEDNTLIHYSTSKLSHHSLSDSVMLLSLFIYPYPWVCIFIFFLCDNRFNIFFLRKLSKWLLIFYILFFLSFLQLCFVTLFTFFHSILIHLFLSIYAIDVILWNITYFVYVCVFSLFPKLVLAYD